MWGDTSESWDAAPGLYVSCSNSGSSPSSLNLGSYNGVVGQYRGGAGVGGAILNINTWYHIVTEITNTSLKIYLDGILRGEAYNLSDIDLWTTAQKFRLAGYALSSPITQLNGYLDEFYILKGILSKEEISWLYNNGIGNTLN